MIIYLYTYFCFFGLVLEMSVTLYKLMGNVIMFTIRFGIFIS